jgi:hypothetical protein
MAKGQLRKLLSTNSLARAKQLRSRPAITLADTNTNILSDNSEMQSNHRPDAPPPEHTEGETLDFHHITVPHVLRGLSRLSIGSWVSLIAALATVVTVSFSFGVGHSGPPSTSKAPATQSVEASNAVSKTGGLTLVASGLSNDQFSNVLAGARSTVTIVIPWFIDPLTAKDALSTILNTPGAEVDVFLLDPASPYLIERGRVAKPDVAGYGPNEARRSVLILADSFARARASARLLFYDSIPAALIVKADNRGIIGFHFHTGVALSNPILFFDVEQHGQRTTIGRAVDAEFRTLRTMAKEIDTKSVTLDAAGQVVYKMK